MDDSVGRPLVIGDINSFNKLFESHYEWACAIAVTFVHDLHAAEDIVTESFVAIWENRANIHTSVRPYLLKVIRNKSLNHIRYLKAQEKLKNSIKIQMLDCQENFILDSEHPFNYVDRQETTRLIEDAIKKLPPQCRRIFVMNHFEEKTYKEISEALNVSENTIKTQLRIAFSKLRITLKDKFILIFFVF
ncbi:MAG: RNA polymerase sigma-70 factor [Bacteroidales bacterium]|jgi:RNA polymerase sigma-70 factor (ECF subfamily)|nr:RNA polymerase sigma-70 factor [Bacteroidales bacterium]